jgi:plastocyanin/mono/diheme cytochrome c family protein
MNTGRNPGLLGLTAGVGLGVLFVLLGFAGVFSIPVGLGLGVIGVFVGAFLYLFFMRGTAVARIGYASLLFVLTLGLIIPILIVTQQQAQATQQSQNYDLTLQRGAALFGQYCSSCHGYQGQGLAAPRLNNNPDVSKLTNDDITRIISGGVPNPENLATFQMPAWSDAFGGPLTEQDIAYLVALIRSSDPQYLKTNNLPSTNGFSYVLASLTNPTQIAEYHEQENNKGSTRPPDSQFVDQTGKAEATISAVNNPPQGGGNWGWVVKGGQAGNVVISVGTKVTWTNESSAPHNVYSGPSGKPDGKFQSPIFAAGGSFVFTFDTPGEYPYYCNLHPYMIGWITVK